MDQEEINEEYIKKGDLPLQEIETYQNFNAINVTNLVITWDYISGMKWVPNQIKEQNLFQNSTKFWRRKLVEPKT